MKTIYILCLLCLSHINTSLTSHIKSSDIEIDEDCTILNQTHSQLKDKENSSYISAKLQLIYPEDQDDPAKYINRQRGEGLPYTDVSNILKEKLSPKIYKR